MSYDILFRIICADKESNKCFARSGHPMFGPAPWARSLDAGP
jgi:hypothetical protein